MATAASSIKVLLCTLLATGWATDATAEIYRCGASGNQYSQQPCADGRLVDAADPRSAQQIDAARQASAEQRKLAQDMMHERERQDRARHSPLATSLGPRMAQAEPAKLQRKTPRSKSRSKKSVGTNRDTQGFVAIEPGSARKARKKSQATQT